MFREDLAEEVKSETIKPKKESTIGKGENIKALIQRENDMFEKLIKATVAGVGEESTQTLVLLFSALQSGFCL